MVHLWKVVWLLSLGLNSAPSLAGLLQCFGSEGLGGIQQHLVLTLLKEVGGLSQQPHRPGPAVSLGNPSDGLFSRSVSPGGPRCGGCYLEPSHLVGSGGEVPQPTQGTSSLALPTAGAWEDQ